MPPSSTDEAIESQDVTKPAGRLSPEVLGPHGRSDLSCVDRGVSPLVTARAWLSAAGGTHWQRKPRESIVRVTLRGSRRTGLLRVYLHSS